MNKASKNLIMIATALAAAWLPFYAAACNVGGIIGGVLAASDTASFSDGKILSSAAISEAFGADNGIFSREDIYKSLAENSFDITNGVGGTRLLIPALSEDTETLSDATENSHEITLLKNYNFPISLENEDAKYVIHAGGVAGENDIGSNSLEALESSYAKGEEYIEMDFSITADGDLACLHGWSSEYSSSIEDGTPLTLEQFKNIKIYDKYTPVYLDLLAEWMAEHDGFYIITDVKDDNVAALTMIANRHPEIIGRILPQIYFADEYDSVRALGYSNIIFTLYRLEWNEKTDVDALLEFAKTHPLYAYTFSSEIVKGDYIERMKASGVRLFCHTINGETEQQRYFAMGIDGVYTDYPEK